MKHGVHRMKHLAQRVLLPATIVLASMAHAQSYPTKAVQIVVPFPPGGTVDVVARIVAQGLTDQMGQTVRVENKAGANGIIGSDFVAKSAPDGYTLLVQASIFVINPLFLPDVPYNVQKNFTPLSNLGSVPLLMVANPKVPAGNLREFVALAKADIKKYTFATSGLGSAGHLAEETVKRQFGIPDLLIVAYKGTAPTLTDLMGGQVSVMIDAMPSAYPHVKSGKLKPLAVSSLKRVSFLPEVPTVAESGLPGFEMVSWYGLWGPAGLPRDIAAKLSLEAARSVRTPLATERLGAQAFDVVGSNSEQFASYIQEEIGRYAKIVKEANIKAE